MNRKGIILTIIVLAQFCCTSLWFASNGVMSDLLLNFNLDANALGYLTSAVQFGFILGTLSFAILTIADRFAPSKVFVICALLGALFNTLLIRPNNNLLLLILFRFLTGFCLAGIYPVGMKIASDYFDKGLGISLSFLVGALVLGTAFPHILSEILPQANWEHVITATSIIAVFGGFSMVILVPNGPYRIAAKRFDTNAFSKVFNNRPFRAAALGYFGHMWELYAFWTFVPLMLEFYNAIHTNSNLVVSLWSFLIIGIGGLACVIGGYISRKIGAKQTAFIFLLLSCICCLLSPLIFSISNPILFLLFLLFWGCVVIADSPLFSTLVAQNAEKKSKGTALTIVNCIGFSITIVSIMIINSLIGNWNTQFLFIILAVGPVLGLIGLRHNT
ncbi:MFS transporter [Winogradskyella sp. DF17]|uniref:MFS transporter n=1 Tax=Winogradskyella pelagia TaxID=2819984 RepID=A0ABS3T3G0_9FLAO|nr:MFS transporter [Winogradskyella sp. DF17]MBO3117267.1 MFS transporter [Winogradskyella sp. DF17]